MLNKYAVTAPTKKAPAANPFSKKRPATEITAPVNAPTPVVQQADVEMKEPIKQAEPAPQMMEAKPTLQEDTAMIETKAEPKISSIEDDWRQKKMEMQAQNN